MRTLFGHWPGKDVAVKARQDMTESCPDLLFLLFLNISIIIIGMRSSLGSIELCPFALALAYL